MEAPKLPSFFKQNRAKSFEFRPRYYDERKERIEKLRRQYSKKQEKPGLAKSQDMRKEALRLEWGQRRQTKVKSSNRSLLFIVAVLFLLTYLILFR